MKKVAPRRISVAHDRTGKEGYELSTSTPKVLLFSTDPVLRRLNDKIASQQPTCSYCLVMNVSTYLKLKPTQLFHSFNLARKPGTNLITSISRGEGYYAMFPPQM